MISVTLFWCHDCRDVRNHLCTFLVKSEKLRQLPYEQQLPNGVHVLPPLSVYSLIAARAPDRKGRPLGEGRGERGCSPLATRKGQCK